MRSVTGSADTSSQIVEDHSFNSGSADEAAYRFGEVENACAAAAIAFDTYRKINRFIRAEFLEQIGAEILAIGDELITTAMRESNLPRTRLEGERGRTVNQLRLFAEVLRHGAFLNLRIDHALPDRRPAPAPDLRLRMIPLGPVAVFGASNFPLAFSTAGGDTASALAAGCPVIVKGHPAHPVTSALVAAAITRAAAASKVPSGVFSHLEGPGIETGKALVQDRRVAAVAFTGSRIGGMALLHLAQARAVPIPVFAEMSSVNPVVLCPNALITRAAALGAGFVQSMTLGAGQFCTNPGLLLAVTGEGLDIFEEAAVSALVEQNPAPMLSDGIHAAFDAGVEALARHPAVDVLARGKAGSAGAAGGRAAFFATDAESYLADPTLGHEVFGASSLLVRCKDESMLHRLLLEAEGQLTATLQMDEGDLEFASRLIPLLERKVGRILANGWPTGVEVTHAMVHGGPYPATSDGRSTSVGSLAIDRFLRPVSYQNFASALLPPELRDDAAEAAPCLIDGNST